MSANIWIPSSVGLNNPEHLINIGNTMYIICNNTGSNPKIASVNIVSNTPSDTSGNFTLNYFTVATGSQPITAIATDNTKLFCMILGSIPQVIMIQNLQSTPAQNGNTLFIGYNPSSYPVSQSYLNGYYGYGMDTDSTNTILYVLCGNDTSQLGQIIQVPISSFSSGSGPGTVSGYSQWITPTASLYSWSSSNLVFNSIKIYNGKMYFISLFTSPGIYIIDMSTKSITTQWTLTSIYTTYPSLLADMAGSNISSTSLFVAGSHGTPPFVPGVIKINTSTGSYIQLASLGSSGSSNFNDKVIGVTAYNNYVYFADESNGTIYQVASGDAPCFKEDTLILCLNEDYQEEYLPIQTLRPGTLVKTFRNGFKPIDMIGTTKLYNPGNKLRSENRLYKCSTSNYQELFEDLYITGNHSILVESITQEQREREIELVGDVYGTDDKFRLMACIDERAEPYDKEGLFNIYHFALECDDCYMNYGIYANGLLVETTSKRYMREYSGMKLIKE
jgi:hypothetical protein